MVAQDGIIGRNLPTKENTMNPLEYIEWLLAALQDIIAYIVLTLGL